MERDTLNKLLGQLAKVRLAAQRQREIGNIDTADHFDKVGIAGHNLVLDVYAMLLSNPNTTEQEIRLFLESHYQDIT
jgi:hypothetical protein